MNALDMPLVWDLDHNSTVAKQLDLSENAQSSSIPSLPVELLSKIFLLASMDDYSGITRIAITHVCYFWRETAINCSHLWSTIHIARSTTGMFPRVVEFQKRSNGAPLSISVDKAIYKDHYRNSRLRMLIIDSLAHTREFSSPVGLVHFLPCPPPILEFLTLTSDSNIQDFSLPRNAFEGHTPSLRKVVLNLRGFRFNWLSSILKDLRELSIQGAQIFHAECVHFLDCLARMPALELLDLRKAKLIGRSPLPRDLPPRNLVLSSLRSFIFSGDLEFCSFILQNLVLQYVQKLDVQILFKVTDSNRQCSSLSRILSFIAGHCDGHDAKLDVRRMTPVTPPPWETSEDGVHSFSYGCDNVQFKAIITGPARSHLPFLEAVRVTLPLKGITYIEIGETSLDD